MKNINVTQLLGYCIIGICIIIAGDIISKNLPETPNIPSNLSVSTWDGHVEYGEFLSEGEIASFLGISSDDARTLIESGELLPYCTKIGDSYVFSKTALEGWMNTRMGM